ncbi:NUDIX domain-containing protein [Desertibacillus haloalkaliphilus]|uniref:NUDIX domain-containing protein n=1 Tax=Desertibacillus haloalkaliphilus TaxID=1328930 RepID=UPI001C2640D1|nr:NUDIX domain-containing protein [Desertibacillus haloalkaliphilus]MBU8905385.1 NUDIX domain-containing protein [Desertibacillus haloalkaliphilus]
MEKQKRGKVWLAAAGIVIKDGKWLVVKKKYGGLKGLWSLPAGFVNHGETVDQAAIREVKEETGIETEVIDLVGLRTGVIEGIYSDNLVIFLLKPLTEKVITQKSELECAIFVAPEQLEKDPKTSKMLQLFLNEYKEKYFEEYHGNPGKQFSYTDYKIFY